MKKLPIGIQTFSKMIEEQYLYVDKTKEILRLITSGDYVFFARPRRFGKSLLVSTLINLIKTLQIEPTEFEHKEVPEVIFDSYDIDKMNVFALLFQTGYLTLIHIEGDEDILYTLDYPNTEVKNAFLTYLLEGFTANRYDFSVNGS